MSFEAPLLHSTTLNLTGLEPEWFLYHCLCEYCLSQLPRVNIAKIMSFIAALIFDDIFRLGLPQGADASATLQQPPVLP